MNKLCKTCKKNPIDISRSICDCSKCLDRKNSYMKNYYKKIKEKIKIYSQKYYQNNKEAIKDKNSRYQKLNREQYNGYNKKYYSCHKKEHSDYQKAHRKLYNQYNKTYQLKHPEKIKQIKHDVYLRRKDKAYEEVRKRRAVKMRVGGTFTKKEWLEVKHQYNDSCLWCGTKERIEADHVVPLSHGGVNSIENIQPLCRKCNAKKFSRIIDFRPFGAAILDWT